MDDQLLEVEARQFGRARGRVAPRAQSLIRPELAVATLHDLEGWAREVRDELGRG